MLSAGNIVQIICQKYVQEYLAFGKIVEITTDNMVVVEIPKIFPNQTKIIKCHADDLDIHEDYPINIKADQLFGKHGWHFCRQIQTPLHIGVSECQYENCEHKAMRRTILNIYGVVCEADLCPEHADQYHGKWCEIFPWKKKNPAT